MWSNDSHSNVLDYMWIKVACFGSYKYCNKHKLTDWGKSLLPHMPRQTCRSHLMIASHCCPSACMEQCWQCSANACIIALDRVFKGWDNATQSTGCTEALHMQLPAVSLNFFKDGAWMVRVLGSPSANSKVGLARVWGTLILVHCRGTHNYCVIKLLHIWRILFQT